MKAAVVLCSLLAACGFAPHAPSAVEDSGGAPPVVDAIGDALGASDGPPADAPSAPFAMSGLHWTVPCINGVTGQAACSVADPAPPPVMQTLDGAGSDHWLVTVHVLGVVESLAYKNGTAGSGDWYVKGDTNGDHANNLYSLEVSSPHVTYFLNNGTPGSAAVIDYMVSLPIDGNATLTFTASGQDTFEWQDYDVATGSNYVVPGLPTPAGLDGGQYAELEVISATRM